MRVHVSTPVSAIATATVALVMAIGASGRGIGAQQAFPPDAPQGGCPIAPATFSSWFESGAPALNGAVKPANSVTFGAQPNCDFYAWSRQMFLWLTSPAPTRYGGGSRIFDSPTFFDVSPPDANNQRTFVRHEPGLIRFPILRISKPGPHNLPVIFDKRHRMFEVQRPKAGPTGKPVVLNAANKEIEIANIRIGPNRKVQFLDAADKPITGAKPQRLAIPTPIAIPAARGRATVAKAPARPANIAQMFILNRGPIFVDLLGNAIDTEEGQATTDAALMSQGHSLVYFAAMVNDVYAYFLTGNKDNKFIPAFTRFPTTQADLTKIAAFAATKGVTFPDGDALAVELKTAWVDASTLGNAGDYITMRATVPTYDTTNPALWVPNGQKDITLALVSMHVVGSTRLHPEMIWATFEHFASAPVATYFYNSIAGQKQIMQTTAGTWLFTANNAAGDFNCQHMSVDVTNGKIVAVPPPGNCNPPVPGTVSPSDTLRLNPFGKPGGAGNAGSNTEVLSANTTTQVPGGDIRNKYFMSGATWTIGGAPPSAVNQVGTNLLANSALETYTQLVNCFGCHNGNMLGDPNGQSGLSHIYGPLKPLF